MRLDEVSYNHGKGNRAEKDTTEGKEMYTTSKTGDSRMDRATEMLSFFYCCGEKDSNSRRPDEARRPRERRSGRRAA